MNVVEIAISYLGRVHITMTGTQEDMSSMISFIKLVETNPCLWNFTLKNSRTDLSSLAWKQIAVEFKDTGKEVQLYVICKV
jgi:hypothetical protein